MQADCKPSSVLRTLARPKRRSFL